MRLSKLEIYGFKSFAKRTEIVFPLNITGIVGPNGSGKSNISDAVRWVLGEQSAKTLRGNSMSDVIFNGTEQRKPMNYCEVTLVFDNADQQLPVAYAEVSITRRVYRSGESEYLMNGAACRLKDVVDLFRDTGVGREGYSIIGQGRIDEILSQRSEDRRAVFEEAAGISRFRARKEEAEQRLRRSDENLVRVEDVLEELARQLAPLEKQAEVAREYLALSETLKELDVALYLLRYGRLEKRSALMENALLTVKDQLRELTDRLAELGGEREHQEAGLEAVQKALAEAHEALLSQNERLHRARETAQEVDNRLQNSAETARRLQSEADAVRARIQLMETTLTQAETGLAQADRQHAAAQEALAERKQAHAAAAEAAQTWEDQLTWHKTSIIDSMNRMQDVRTTQARQSAMQAQMTARREELRETLSSAQEKDQTLQAALFAAKQNLALALAAFETRRAEAGALETRAQALAEALKKRQQEAQELQQGVRADEARLKTLRELQEGYEGYQYPVRQALSFAKQNGLTGVHNVVAMLLSVPKEYETALDMALGGAMQNIVTDTERDAKRLIDHLRDNRLGRATFLPLSAVRGRTLTPGERRVLSLKGCLGVASELCAFEERYRPVMENLLGRTIIAEDLDSGIEIMRAGGHAFRLVTLAGDVMHSGGSMTGGSIQQKAQNLLGREREMKELEAALSEGNTRALEASRAAEAMEAERATLREERLAAREAVQQQEIAVVRDTERQRAAQSELEEHTRAAQSVRQAIEQLDESLADVEKELARIEALSGQEETDAEAMQAQTVTLGAKLDQARREREAAQEALTQALLAQQESEHTCDRLRRDQKRLAADCEESRKEREGLLARREQALADGEAAGREREAAAETVTLAETAVTRAKTAVEETEHKREEAQRALKDLQSEIEASRALGDKIGDRLHRQELSLARVKAEMGQLNDRLWDTYELTYAGARQAHDEYVLIRSQANLASEGDAGAQPGVTDGAADVPASAEHAPLEASPASPAQAKSGVTAAATAQATAQRGAALPEASAMEGVAPDTTAQDATAQDELDAEDAQQDAVADAGSAAVTLPEGLDEASADRRAMEIRERIKRMGNVNVGAIEEYALLRERYGDLTAQRDDLRAAKEDLQALIANLLSHMRTVFVGQFEQLQGYFEETFARLFGGGHGEIRLTDPENPLECGIDIIVQPPGKKRQILSLFSGGERALTAIAILFAMLKLKPTPFCILDEIEAALDEANISYFAEYLREFSQGTQFVVVTHRKGTMERCDTLFGVAMEERGVSSMVSVSLKDYD